MRHSTTLGRAVGTAVVCLVALAALAAGGAVAQEHSAGPTSTAVENVDQNATYSSIQAAVDNASTGDTILVGNGTYNESVSVDVSGLTVTATEGATATVVGQSAVAVTVQSDGVTVSNLTVRNPVGPGDAPQDRAAAVGIEVSEGATGVTVADNVVTDIATQANTNPRGVLVFSGADSVKLLRNDISDIDGTVDVAGAAQGIQFFESGNGQGGALSSVEGAVIRGNTVTDVTDNRSAVGLQFNGNISGTIAGNQFADIGSPSTEFSNGIALSAGGAATGSPSGVEITRNTIENISGSPARALALGQSSIDGQTVGPRNVRMTRNTIDNLSSTGGFPPAALFVGAYKNLGDNHAFTENDILDGIVTRSANLSSPVTFIRDADALDAVDNWWGDASGPGGAGPGTGQRVFPDPTSPPFSLDDPEVAVNFDPFLEQPVDETFFSIQEAIDRASPGDTVEVPPGVFDESVVVDVPRLTLVAADPTARPVVRGNPAVANSAVNVTADGVTVDGLAVETQTRDGILVSDPVDNVTIENTQIRNVAGAVGGKAAGNGIELFYTGSTQASSNVTIRNNRIANVTTPDASVEADAIGVQVLPRGSDIEGLTIADNVITGIDPGNSTGARSDGRAISIGTQLVNGSGVVSGLTVTDNDIEGVTGESVRGIALFESDTDPAFGPTNFTVTRNRFASLDASGGFEAEAFYVGAYKNLGASHAFTENNVLDGSVVRFADTSDGIGSAIEFIQDPNTDALNAVGNWWGNTTGPSGAGPGSGQAVVPDPAQFGIQNPEIAVEFTPFRGTPAVDVTGNERVAGDTDGDTLLDDVNGDNESDLTDVQALFDSLGDPAVQNNAESFGFADVTPDKVTVLDVQELFNQL